jgi:1-phosphofructokinase
MIVTVTPNPSIDRTLRIPSIVRGGLVRAASASAEAGGKGINVSRALTTEGHPTLAVVPLSESSAAVVQALLGGAAPIEAVTIAGDARINISLVEDDGTVTKVNEPGPMLDEQETEELLARTATVAAGAIWVAGCGSLPPGMPADFYARLVRRMPTGVRVAIDAEGPALRACLGERVALIKPNHGELEGLIGRRLPTLGDVIAAATELIASGIETVLVSLGADGALHVDRTGATHVEARIDGVQNNVGAGDALLAGYLAADGGRDALASAVAWSVAACRSPGTAMRSVTPADRDAVTIHDGTASSRRLAA